MHVHVVFSKASLTIFANISIFARVGCHVMRRKNLFFRRKLYEEGNGKILALQILYNETNITHTVARKRALYKGQHFNSSV